MAGYLPQATAGAARHRFCVGCGWVRWAARQVPKNQLHSMMKVVEKPLAGILAHWKWSLINAFMEGIEQRLQRDPT